MKIVSHLVTATSVILAGASVGIATPNADSFCYFWVGSILPDIDVYWKVESSKKSLLLSHRGWTHHLILPVIIALIALTIHDIHIVYLSAGILFHDIMDSFSYTGVPYGLKYWKRIRFKVYKTGGLSEMLFVFAFIVLSVASIIIANNHLNLFSHQSLQSVLKI